MYNAKQNSKNKTKQLMASLVCFTKCTSFVLCLASSLCYANKALEYQFLGSGIDKQNSNDTSHDLNLGRQELNNIEHRGGLLNKLVLNDDLGSLLGNLMSKSGINKMLSKDKEPLLLESFMMFDSASDALAYPQITSALANSISNIENLNFALFDYASESLEIGRPDSQFVIQLGQSTTSKQDALQAYSVLFGYDVYQKVELNFGYAFLDEELNDSTIEFYDGTWYAGFSGRF